MMLFANSKHAPVNSGRRIGSMLLISLFVLITISAVFSAGVAAQSGVSIQLEEPDRSVSANTTVTQSQVPQIKPSQPLTFDKGNNYEFIIHDEDTGGTITTTPSVNVTTSKPIVLPNPLYPGVNTPSSFKGTFQILAVTSGPVDAPVSSSGSITSQGITNLSVSLVDANTGSVIDRTKAQPYVIGYHKDGSQNSTTGQIQVSVNQSVLPSNSNLTATVYDASVPYPRDTIDKVTLSLSHNPTTNTFTGTFDSNSVAGGNYSVFYNGTLSQPYNTNIGKYFRNNISVSNSGSSTPSKSGGYVDVSPQDLAGSGSSVDPYLLTNVSELQAIEDDLTAHYALGGDIDASSTANWYNGAGFSPIGNASAGFSGSLDGEGHNITNLTIDRSSTENVGLIGEADGGATIESINLRSVTVAGKDDVGSLVGELGGNSVVRDAKTSGVITGKNSTGGLVGVTKESSTVVRSSANGTVSGLDKIGGLVGSNLGGVVTESSSHAAVTGQTNQSRRAGGLVGGNFDGAVINQSYATGSVDGAKVGGITGENYDSSRVTLTYATGSLNGTSGLTGGIVGENFKSCPFGSQSQLCSGFGASTVSDSYWDTQTTGEPASAGNATGLTTAEMTGSSADTTMTGFDFQSTWTTRSNGYPVLKSKQSAGPGDVTGDGVAAKDPDNDGVYEDINGDSSADLRDLQPFFNIVRPSASPPNNPSFFDINRDSSADLRDLQPFFNEVRP